MGASRFTRENFSVVTLNLKLPERNLEEKSSRIIPELLEVV
jgi:hypothetical protein